MLVYGWGFVGVDSGLGTLHLKGFDRQVSFILFLGFSAMGKSPGRWIKAVLFGKKPSKSNLSKKTATEKDTVLAAKAPSSDRPKSSPAALDQALYSADETGEISGLATGTANLPNDGVFLLPGSQDAITKGSMEMGPPNDAEKTQQEQEQAVTKIQATYRSYLARRAFRALKGIIRLQAVVRGHLVRRQAVVTLYCMRGIVNLQALVRGRKVRFSEAGLEVQKRSNVAKALDAKQVDLVGAIRTSRLEKLSANTFVVKLLASTPTSVPLHLQYDPMELNSAWSWLDRWSSSRFWEPLMQPKKACDLKSQRKQANKRSVELEKGRPKRVARRVSTINSDHSVPLASEYEKPKHSMRKSSTLSSESVQENPQKELERVKHNLRKVSVSNTEANNRLETVTEKSKHISRKVSTSLAPDVLEHIAADASDKSTDVIVTVSKEFKEPETNIPPNSLSVDEPTDVLHNDHPVMEVHNIENSGEYKNTAMMNEELASKEDQTIKESQKVRRRRSLPLTQEYVEDASQNNPTLPSYMAATKSAKAKARGQGSLRLTQDEVENGFVRRHSLSSAPNGKVTSLSPRMQRLAHSGGKGGSKSDRSLSSSRDCQEKAEWRR